MSSLFHRVLLPLCLLPSHTPSARVQTHILIVVRLGGLNRRLSVVRVVVNRKCSSTRCCRRSGPAAARCTGLRASAHRQPGFHVRSALPPPRVERHSACDTISGFCWVGPTADCSVLPCKAWRSHPSHLSCISLSLALWPAPTHRTTSEEEALLEEERR